jgi:processive 1,2-diacylglycerol beta-glucosyltransferase
MTAPRILILSASVGSGHGRAAQAVELALRELRPDTSIANIDVLDLTNPLFRRLYGRGYFDLVANAPHLIGYLYDRLDKPLRRWERPIDRMRFGMQGLNMRHLVDLLTSRPWDLAINTHFLPAEVIANLRRSGRVEFPQVTVTTDFDAHRLWFNPPCEHYFTATQEGRSNLAAWGISLEQISATGIPIHPAFSRHRDAWACKRRLGIPDDRPVILQMSGGLGIGPIEKLHRELLDVSRPLQLLVVTGRNAKARQKLEAMPCPAHHRRIIFGFTDRMDELMAAADVIVSKPGGLTTSEALSRGAAMIIVDPIPGQETRNSDYVLENGAAIKVNNLASLGHKLATLLGEPGRLAAMRLAALKLSRPRAAFDIAEHCLKLLPAAAPTPPCRSQPVAFGDFPLPRFLVAGNTNGFGHVDTSQMNSSRFRNITPE